MSVQADCVPDAEFDKYTGRVTASEENVVGIPSLTQSPQEPLDCSAMNSILSL